MYNTLLFYTVLTVYTVLQKCKKIKIKNKRKKKHSGGEWFYGIFGSVTLLTQATLKRKKKVEVLTQHSPSSSVKFSSPADKPWCSQQKCWRSIANTATLKLWGGETFRPAFIFLFLFRQNSEKLYPIIWFDSKQTLNMWAEILSTNADLWIINNILLFFFFYCFYVFFFKEKSKCQI